MTAASEHTPTDYERGWLACETKNPTLKLRIKELAAQVVDLIHERDDCKQQLTACRDALAAHKLAFRDVVQTGLRATKKAEAERDKLREACYEALELVKTWHGEPGWTTYHDHSPEMKRIRTALEATQ